MCGDRGLPIALLVLAFAPAARAENQADVEFRRGRDLMAQGKFAEACAAFDSSQAIEFSVATMLNQANCREKNGQLATARALYGQAARQTSGATDAKHTKLHRVALDRAAKLRPRVSTITIHVPPASQTAGLAIKRGAVAIEPSAWGTPLELDGGTYTFEATAPDRAPWSRTVALGIESDHQTLAVPALENVTRPPATEAPPATAAPATDVPTTPSEPPRATGPEATTPVKRDVEHATPPDRIAASRTPALVVGGAGLALMAASGGFLLWGNSIYDEATAEGNDARQHALWQSANLRGYFAQGFAVAGVASLAAATYLYLRAGDRVVVAPGASDERVSIAVSGRF